MKVYLEKGAFLPERVHSTDAGMDLRSPSPFTIAPKGSALVNTFVHICVPEGCVGFIKSKSGLNSKHDIQCEGVVDAGYSGPIFVKLQNLGNHTFDIEPGDKIAQFVLLPIAPVETVTEVDSKEFMMECNNISSRGDGRFGSTGK